MTTALEKLPILIGHTDTLLRLHFTQDPADNFFNRVEGGHIDLPRAREGWLAGGFFAVFIPGKERMSRPQEPIDRTVPGWYEQYLPPALESLYAIEFAHEMMARLFRIERESQGQVKIARTAHELQACLNENIFAPILHFEGAEAIDRDLNALEVYYQAGLRSLGFVWSRPNIFGHGVPLVFQQTPDTGPGLTDAGKALVKECNRLGIMIDLSHLNEKGFWDVAALSTAPLVATHSNAHALNPAARNLTDKQFAAIKESGGVVGLNFNVYDVRADGEGNPDTPLEDFVRHIDYMVKLMGIDHVAIGTDYDGAKMPTVMSDVSKMPRLFEALATHGYDQDALEKMATGNWLRVLSQTWH